MQAVELRYQSLRVFQRGDGFGGASQLYVEFTQRYVRTDLRRPLLDHLFVGSLCSIVVSQLGVRPADEKVYQGLAGIFLDCFLIQFDGFLKMPDLAVKARQHQRRPRVAWVQSNSFPENINSLCFMI